MRAPDGDFATDFFRVAFFGVFFAMNIFKLSLRPWKTSFDSASNTSDHYLS
jgi:hypothetical protein